MSRGWVFFILEGPFNLSPVGNFIGSAYQASAAAGRQAFGSSRRSCPDPSAGRSHRSALAAGAPADDDAILSASTRLNNACRPDIGEIQKLERRAAAAAAARPCPEPVPLDPLAHGRAVLLGCYGTYF